MQITTTKHLTISEEEFEKVCQFVRQESVNYSNSFLMIGQEPSIGQFIKALRAHLFTEGLDK